MFSVVEEAAQGEKQELSSNMRENERLLKVIFKNCSDVVIRVLPNPREEEILIVYVDGLVDTKQLEQTMNQLLMSAENTLASNKEVSLGNLIRNHLVLFGQTKNANKVEDLINGVLKANIAIIMSGEGTALLVDASGFEKRSIEESKTENVISGPRDSFTETLRTNTSLLRRRIPSSQLKMESFTVGKLTQTDVVLVYIEGVAPDALVENVRQRLQGVQLKGILDSSYIEEYIQDSPWSPFPQIQKTDRPDTTAASLMEGRVAIIANCTPCVLILPITFWTGMQSADDHYERFDFVVARKAVRYIMMMVSLIFPALYVALTAYNPELLPGSLYQSIATAREKSPFPTVIEVVIMDFIFEGLQEAGIRMPSQLGPIVSIVGALVVGEAAVKANIISAPIVIVVALTGIAAYGIPRYGFSIPLRLLRFFLVVLAGIYGLYGLSLGLIAILIHLVTLESFGVRYLMPVAPLNFKRLRDVALRTVRWPRRSPSE
ncbi:spore germination protein [Paenibacillus albus]|nr:spore germination protein [Paenibacillus albus]